MSNDNNMNYNNKLNVENNKPKRIVIIIALVLIVAGILIGILIIVNSNNINNNATNNQVNQEEDNKITNTGKNNEESCFVVVNDANSFVNKVQSLIKICDEYEIAYKNLKYVAKKNSSKNYEAYTNKIYYLDNELEYIIDNPSLDSNILKSYILSTTNEIEKFLFVFHEVPVTQSPKYYIIIFNTNGEIEFLKNVNVSGKVVFDESTKELSYSVETLQMPSVLDGICDYLNQYDRNMVYYETYTYKYDAEKMSLITKKEKVIGDLLQQYTCSKEDVDSNIVNNEKQEINIIIKTIDLVDKSEQLVFDDNLTINFVGNKVEGTEDNYLYTAEILLNGKNIDLDVFNDKNNIKIWSSNHAANFKVEKLNDIYFIISSVAKQNDGDYVLIFKDNGEIISSFDDVSFIDDSISLKNNKIIYEISDCKTSSVIEECSYKKYTIE